MCKMNISENNQHKRFCNLTLSGGFCSCALFFVFVLPPLCSENNTSIPSAVEKECVSSVMMPQSLLSSIDLGLASALRALLK